MKQNIIALGILLTASSTVILGVETKQAGSAQEELVNLERARLAAFAKDDKPTFSKMVADEALITHGFGNVMTKAEEMAVMRPSTPERPLPALSIEEPKVQLYGDAAVMTGNLVETASDGRRELVLRFTNTYIKKETGWQMVAGQLTTLSRERAIAKVDPKIYADYVGQYKNQAGRIRTVAAEGGKLTSEVAGDKLELFPEAENQFFMKEADVILVFVKDEQGKIIRLINRRPNGDVAQEVKVQ
jgi:hypothetical protein